MGPVAKAERRFDAVLAHVFLTHMVPFRPVGNRAYNKRTVDRFRPYVERLLGDVWTGHRIVALGQTAFLWFARYAPPDAVKSMWADHDRRFDEVLTVTIGDRTIELVCVPHPSPLSPFKARFADLLRSRLGG